MIKKKQNRTVKKAQNAKKTEQNKVKKSTQNRTVKQKEQTERQKEYKEQTEQNDRTEQKKYTERQKQNELDRKEITPGTMFTWNKNHYLIYEVTNGKMKVWRFVSRDVFDQDDYSFFVMSNKKRLIENFVSGLYTRYN